MKASLGGVLAGVALLLVGADFAAPDVDPRLRALTSGDPERTAQTLSRLTESPEASFAAPLIELLRAGEIGIVRGVDPARLVRALESTTGQSYGSDWPAWVRWYSKTDLVPPRGFTGWKGALLGRIDPRFARLLPYGAPSHIRTEEIVWGGVAYEGIPALDRPSTVSAAEASYLEPREPVFGLAIGDDARAYPLRILDWHEMANDVVGGVPVSLAYCTLCGSGIVYDGRGPDGTAYDFGSSGFLMRSNKLMVDRQTGTLWNQLTGRPVVGPVAEDDFRLRVLPSVVTSWESWVRRHPETRVLSLETGHERPYEPGAAYGDYFASDGTMFPVAGRGGAIAPKARIFGLEVEGLPKAFPLDRLLEERVVNDHVGAGAIVVVTSGERLAVSGRSARTGKTRQYDAGAEVRAYARGTLRFEAGSNARELIDGEGRVWRVTESALTREGEASLPRIPGTLSYWFAWSGYHPRTAVYSPAD
ncbi:MAG: DUF3179 domain-containing protein [Myxococcota bacterium]